MTALRINRRWDDLLESDICWTNPPLDSAEGADSPSLRVLRV